MGACTAFIFAALLEFTLTNYLWRKGRRGSSMARARSLMRGVTAADHSHLLRRGGDEDGGAASSMVAAAATIAAATSNKSSGSPSSENDEEGRGDIELREMREEEGNDEEEGEGRGETDRLFDATEINGKLAETELVRKCINCIYKVNTA